MARGTRIVTHESAILALRTDAGVKDDMHDRGERVLEAARDNAPVLTGDYKAGLHLEEGENGEVRVAGSSDHDIYVEAETGNLSRALDAAGGS